jgi:hypothetical protein
MKTEFPRYFTGGAFVAAAVMLWSGWLLMPVHLRTFFQADDFAKIHDQFYVWIWTYRIHLFGMVMTSVAMVALAALVAQSECRVVLWPAAAVVAAGMFVGAVGAAFYYHHGAWGALELAGKSPQEVQAFVEALRIDTEYVTCLVRFSRVFSGLGFLLAGWALIQWRVLPVWIGVMAIGIGLVAMALTMGLPDQLELYLPVFHVTALWLGAAGIELLRKGPLK